MDAHRVKGPPVCLHLSGQQLHNPFIRQGLHDDAFREGDLHER